MGDVIGRSGSRGPSILGALPIGRATSETVWRTYTRGRGSANSKPAGKPPDDLLEERAPASAKMPRDCDYPPWMLLKHHARSSRGLWGALPCFGRLGRAAHVYGTPDCRYVAANTAKAPNLASDTRGPESADHCPIGLIAKRAYILTDCAYSSAKLFISFAVARLPVLFGVGGL